MTWDRFVTDFADEALLLPLAASVALLFLVLGWRRGLVAWVGAIGATLGFMLVLKILTIACAGCWFGPALTSPSGHTAAGAAIYGALLALLLARRPGPGAPARAMDRALVRALGRALACVLAVAVLIGATRLSLGVHTLAEVLVGGVVGTAGAMAFVRGAGPRPDRVRPWFPIVLVLVVAAALHGTHLPAESNIRRIAVDWVPFCQQCR